jgi:hypothetical protein
MLYIKGGYSLALYEREHMVRPDRDNCQFCKPGL